MIAMNACIVSEELLMKGKFDKFDESWSHHQTKTIQHYVSNISTSIIIIYDTKHTHKIHMYVLSKI